MISFRIHYKNSKSFIPNNTNSDKKILDEENIKMVSIYKELEESNIKMINMYKKFEKMIETLNNFINTEVNKIREYSIDIKDETISIFNKSVDNIKNISENNMIIYVNDINKIMSETINQVTNMLIKTAQS